MSDVPIDELVRTIGDDPDLLHTELTPSVLALIERGRAGGQAIAPLLNDPDPEVRRHARRVLDGIVMYRHGWRPGRGYPDPEIGEGETEAVLRAISYDPESPAKQRSAAAARWREWLEAQS